MKQFSGLYPQYSMSRLSQPTPSQPPTSKLSTSRNPMKPLAQVKKKQSKIPATIHYQHTQSSRKSNMNIKQKQIRKRLSRSIQQLPHLESEESIDPLFGNRRKGAGNGYTDRGGNGKEILIQNCEEEGEDGQDQEFFGQPYRKLSKVYKNFGLYNSKTGIEQQLSQILEMIKQQRQIIRTRLSKIQQKTPKFATTTASSQTTQQIIQTNPQIQTAQSTTQTEPIEGHRLAQQKQINKIGSNQTYIKLIKILQDMKIDPKLIIPSDVRVEEEEEEVEEEQEERVNGEGDGDGKGKGKGSVKGGKKYQELKQSQIITVQKFVIKKLVQRITSMEQEGGGQRQRQRQRYRQKQKQKQ